jgi:glycosyltransferase involved in cell wall biosynthesis
MKILVEAANHAYSFVIQAEALAKGFSQIGVKNYLLLVTPSTDIISQLDEYKPDIIISVGNWIDFDLLVKTPQTRKYRVIPWIVSDDYLITKFVKEYNTLPLVVTPSNHCKENLVRSGIKEEIIKVIPEAVDCDIWQPITSKEKSNLLEYLSVPIVSQSGSDINKYNLSDAVRDGTPILYTTGGDATKKGAQEVIKALSLLDKNIPWIYIIKTWPGIVTLKNSIEELNLAKELGVIDRIKYIIGEYSQKFMLALMNLCDIYTAPSRLEGFGLPLVEAQMCGKPVVTTFGTATQETVVQGKTGLICKGETTENNLVKANIADLSRCLGKLITNIEIRQEMGKNAKQHAKNNYSPKIIAQRFLTLIDNL